MTEDQHRQQQSPPKERKSIHDIRNQDLVSRFLAATPPYLYSAPVGPNNFFFSDMLRSLVQARNNENARNLQIQQAALGRRPRKRPWSSHRPYYEHLKERKELIADEKPPASQLPQHQPSAEKPLELTNKQLFPISAKYQKTDHHRDDIAEKINSKIHHHNNNSEHKVNQEFNASIQNETPANIQEPPAASLPPSDLVLPPPPPVWYPSIYPPYGIDPLHFFIDLRVSGHIYDRKKDNVSPESNADNNVTAGETDAIGKHRHGSAFTVPPPRIDSTKTNTTSVGNLDLDKINNGYKYYDLSSDTKENPLNHKNTNYVLQNLPRIYTHVNSRDSDNDVDNKSDIDDLTEDTLDKENSNHIDVEVVENVRSRSNETRSSNSSGEDQGSGEIHQID